MAEVLSQEIPVLSDPAVASYNYTDLAEGTGTVVYYGGDTTDNATQTYFLSANAVYSDHIISYDNGTAGVENILDIDFDLSPYNLPQVVKGNLRAILPVLYGHETTAGKGGTIYCIVKVRKWDGASETELASNTKSLVTPSVGDQDTKQFILNVEVDCTNSGSGHHFKIGETLRITVEVWAATQGGNGIQLGLFHSPKNRDDVDNVSGSPGYYPAGFDSGEFISSVLEFHVPYKINK